MKDLIANNSEKFFEYHCWESHQSSDAELWYRSQQKVMVLNVTNYEPNLHDNTSFADRGEMGHQLVYKIKFADSYEGDAFEDELLNSESGYQRPAPPKPHDWKKHVSRTRN
jgi:hypothetical protein